MTRANLLQNYAPQTPEYVVMHARYQASRGRKPSATLDKCRNPKRALELAKIFAYFPPTINLQGAKKVAEVFRRLDKVQAVEVFGSVARGQEGHDLDLILVCDEETSQEFMTLVEIEARLAKLPRMKWYDGCALSRSCVAESILVSGIASENNPFEEAIIAAHGVGIDIFIFPSDWRNRLSELQGRMEHDDPNFMQKIAKDARRIT